MVEAEEAPNLYLQFHLLTAARQIRQRPLITAMNSGGWLPTIQTGCFGLRSCCVNKKSTVSSNNTFYFHIFQIK
jgi:hypothetical protein